MTTRAQKAAIATELLPLYNSWHTACVKDYTSGDAYRLERALWNVVRAHHTADPNLKLPTTITASIGRWIARELNMKLTRVGIVVPAV